MESYLLARLVAVASVLSLNFLFTGVNFTSLVFSFAMSHYLLAFVYSRNAVGLVVQSKIGILCFVSLGILSVLITRYNFPSWLVYGILHYLLGDVLVPSRSLKGHPSLMRRVVCLRLLFNFIASIIVFANQFGMVRLAAMGTPYACALLMVVYSLVVWDLSRHRAEIGAKTVVNQCLFDGIILIVVAFVYLGGTIRFEHTSMVHFVFWAVLPMVGLNAKRPPLAGYVTATCGVFLAVFVMTPFFNFPGHLSMAGLLLVWAYFSNFHITCSFLLSRDLLLTQSFRRLSKQRLSAVR